MGGLQATWEVGLEGISHKMVDCTSLSKVYTFPVLLGSSRNPSMHSTTAILQPYQMAIPIESRISPVLDSESPKP